MNKRCINYNKLQKFAVFGFLCSSSSSSVPAYIPLLDPVSSYDNWLSCFQLMLTQSVDSLEPCAHH